MKKLIILSLACIMAFSLCGCSEETRGSAVEVFDGLKGLGENLYNDFDEAVQAYTTPSAEQAGEEYDRLSDTIERLCNSYYVDGSDVLSVISGAKSSGLTIMVQRVGDEKAQVVGKLVTYDACEYVKDINELPEVDGEYLYDFCGLNGIIRSTISTMANRKFGVYQYDAYSTNVKPFADITKSDYFDVLILTEGKQVVGFYFNEQEAGAVE